MGPASGALRAVLPALRCPNCQAALALEPTALEPTALACPDGHSFDLARHGYVNLTTGRPAPQTGDASAMVAARERFLARGHYRPLTDGIAALAQRLDPGEPAGVVVELAGGPGYHLAHTLDALPHRHGLCIDVSKAALRRAARRHVRMAAIGADVWGPLPLARGSAALVLSVFGPRNPAETERVLIRGGSFLVATPTPTHLGEVIGPLGMVSIDPAKEERLGTSLARFRLSAEAFLNYQATMDADDLGWLVGMGPSSHHLPPDALASRLAALPTPATVTISIRLAAYQAGRVGPGGVGEEA